MVLSAPRRLSIAALAAGSLTLAAGGTVLAGSTPADDGVSGTLNVFAAASLTDAFTELSEAFAADHRDVEIVFSFDSSSNLVSQIIEGAPADLFASADIANMDKLVDADLAADIPVIFATNSLAIAVEVGNPLGIETLHDLADPDLVVVSAAPEVPIGAYTLQALEAAGVEVELDSLEENVRDVRGKVESGEADAGIVYATDVASSDAVDGVEIAPEFNVIADYPLAVTADAANPDAAEAFSDFILSDAGQEILAGYGFGSPADSDAASDSIPDTTAA